MSSSKIFGSSFFLTKLRCVYIWFKSEKNYYSIVMSLKNRDESRNRVTLWLGLPQGWLFLYVQDGCLMASDWSIFTDLGRLYAKIQKNVKSWSLHQSVWIWPVSSWFKLVFGLLTTNCLWCENWICLEKTLFRANEWSCEFHRLDFILKHWTALCNRPISISILTSQIGQSNVFTTNGNSVGGNITIGWHWVILTYLCLTRKPFVEIYMI